MTEPKNIYELIRDEMKADNWDKLPEMNHHYDYAMVQIYEYIKYLRAKVHTLECFNKDRRAF